MAIERLESEALKLPAHLRARLAERLISSLDEDAEIDQIWADEAQRRYEELKTETAKGRQASEVFREARSGLG